MTTHHAAGLRSVTNSATVRGYFRRLNFSAPLEGKRIEALDGTALFVHRVALGAVVSTISYVLENDPTGRILHCNLMMKGASL